MYAGSTAPENPVSGTLFVDTDTWDMQVFDGTHSHSVTVNSGGAHGHALSIGSSGGTEARPRNVAANFIIKT